ncbi:MAG: type ISP restriction/modification enzyme, partial [Pseudomonadota bacterium]
GTVPAIIKAALKRLIGFELQFGPFAVAQLRLLAEIAELTDEEAKDADDTPLRLYVADTLADPNEEMSWIPALLQPVADSRRAANTIKRDEPITVVIGNPPYKEKAKGLGDWVENGHDGLNAPLATWFPPPSWNAGEHSKHLRNLYVYFWRWATWKVFGDSEIPGTPPGDEKGVICYITVAGFLNGPGFQKMRADLRRDADHIWVIDCSPDGHQPAVSTRIFQDVQQPICIVLAARTPANDPTKPARVRFRALPLGARADKFTAISLLALGDGEWVDAAKGWRASFLPEAATAWSSYPGLDELFIYDGSGVMPGRTWVIAPDAQSLKDRWARLTKEPSAERKAMLFHPHLRNGGPGDKHVDKLVIGGLAGHPHRPLAVAKDTGAVAEPVRYGFRSFDRQWLIPDSRLINQPNPNIWAGYSSKQVYLTALSRYAPTTGPAATITGLVPDLDHYKGSFGGRIFPLWANQEATVSNIRPELQAELAAVLGREVSGEDIFAYVAAITAHPGYIARFAKNLVQPGLRIPLTASADLFEEAVRLGREVIWLHSFGERFAEGRPAGPPRMPADGPTIPKAGAIPTDPDKMPDSIDYDAATRQLRVGSGYVDNVPPEVWAYEVSGKPVLRQWFSYRGKDRSRPIMGDRRPPSLLGEIQPDGWLAEYTTELLNVLHVLGRLVALEPAQADLLGRIVDGPVVEAEALRASGALPELNA